MKNFRQKLRRLLNVPDFGTDEFEDWRKQDNDAMKFLHQNSEDDWVVIYSESNKMFIHGVLVPEQALRPLDTDDILKWQYNPYHSWRVVSCDSKTCIEPPLADSCSKTLTAGEQLVFVRSSEEVSGDQRCVEISQKFTHSLDLHYRPDQKAWFMPDKNGNTKPFVKVIEESNTTIVLFDRNLLSAYATLTDSVLVRMFDLPVYYEAAKSSNIHYQISRGMRNNFYRGVQLLKLAMSKKKATETVGIKLTGEKSCETFTALDWQNNRVVEASCSADSYKLLPAFFCQEVLSKYKFDQNKYSFSEYAVDGTTYGINDEGQVHVWLVDLAKMPSEEQRHWKLYNEEPRPTITDFDQEPEQILKSVLNEGFFDAQIKGSWDYSKTRLSMLKETLSELHESNCQWWKTVSLERIGRINYPIAKSFNDCADWEREILSLYRLVVEGLRDDCFKSKLNELGRDTDGIKGSLNLLEKYLEALKDRDTIRILAPLRELKKLRNKTSPAHEQLEEKDESEAKTLTSEILKAHGSYWKHYDYLVEACCQSFQNIKEVFEKSKPHSE